MGSLKSQSTDRPIPTSAGVCFPLTLATLLLTACTPKHKIPEVAPRPPSIRDVTFHSRALARDTTYRVLTPATYPAGPIHILYLLHGSGGGYRDWTSQSHIASLASRGYVLVMPDGGNSYFLNSALNRNDRYEDFLTQELIADAEQPLPPGPKVRAIAGVSMGGFAAIVLAYKHPDLYPFAAALSPPVDVPQRSFNTRRPLQSWSYRSIFGPPGSPTRTAADPFLLARALDPSHAPYLFLTTGHESLETPIRRFEYLLTQRHLPHEFHTNPGGHTWQQWDAQLPALFTALNSKPSQL
jgi:putative tributyrin esterase